MPLEGEFLPFTEYLISEGHKVEMQEAKTPTAWFEDLGLIVSVAGHGKAQFAVVTQHLVESTGPFGVIIAAGSAGALARNIRPCDIVLATETVEHDYKAWSKNGAPVPPRHACSSLIRESIEKAQEGQRSFRLHTGAIASGDEDVADEGRAVDIHKKTHALCVAWEGAGGAKAARFNGIPFLEIRAITDAANADSPESFRRHLADAVENIGRVLLPWLRDRFDNN